MNVKKFIAGICVFLAGVLLKVLSAVNIFSTWVDAIGIPLMVLGIFLCVYSFKWKNRHDVANLNRLPVLTDEEKNKILYFEGLAFYKDKMLRLFYKENAMERIVIYRHDQNCVCYAKERLVFFDEEELQWCNTYGYWVDSGSGGRSFFQDEELALHELKNELREYTEIDTKEIIYKDSERVTD